MSDLALPLSLIAAGVLIFVGGMAVAFNTSMDGTRSDYTDSSGLFLWGGALVFIAGLAGLFIWSVQ